MNRPIPGPMWLAIISLSLMIMGKLLAVFKVGPLILIDAALSAILLWGLIKRQKWAYFLTVVFVVFGTVMTLRKGAASGLAVFFLDGLVLVPVLICTKWFFPENTKL